MNTNKLSAKNITRSWHLVDVKDAILGRASSQIARILIGKNKPNYVTYLDMGDTVVVINAALVKVSGKKLEQKKYFRHSGYPGGLREEGLDELLLRKPEQVIIHAVKGMLPKNKLGPKMLKRLHVFAKAEHPFTKNLNGGGVNAK